MRRTLIFFGFGGLLVACSSLLGDFEPVNENGTLDGSVGNDGNVPQDDGSTPPQDGTVPDDSSTDAGADAPKDAASEIPTGPAVAVVSKSDVRFGNVNCGGFGGPVPDQLLTLSNTGGAPLTWSAALDSTASFTLKNPVSGTIQPGSAPATLTLSAVTVPASATAGSVRSATLTITTNDTQHTSIPVSVSLVAHGGTLTVTPGTADFGQVPNTVQATDIPVNIVNTGNADITVGFTPPMAGSDFGFVWTGGPAAASVPAGANVPGAAARFKPTSLANQNTDVPIVVSGPMCGTSPTAVHLHGQGTASLVGISPGTLDFGATNCGAQAGAQSVTVSNSGNIPFTITGTSVNPGAAYYVVTTPNGTTVNPGASVQVVVTPNATPSTASTPGTDFGGTLTITTNSGAGTSTPITLTHTARGAVVAVNPVPPTPLALGSVTLGAAPASNSFSMQNSGNVNVNWSAGLNSGRNYQLASTSGSLSAAGTPTSVGVTFSPTLPGSLPDTVNLTFTLAAGDVFCGSAPPSTVGLTGTGGCPAMPPLQGVNANDAIEPREVSNAHYLCFQQSGVSPALPASCSFNAGNFLPSSNWPPTATEMNLPVVGVNWCQAFAYCVNAGRHLCGAPGGGPVTVANFNNITPATSLWTQAASSNGTYDYPYSSTYDSAKCNTSEHMAFGRLPVGSLPGCTAPAAPWNGIMDMSGNVLEWEDACDGTAGGADHCRTRGGAYDYSSLYDKVQGTTSYSNPAYTRQQSQNDVGFRCCK